jgi:segregation and condensation protein A
MSYRIAIGPFEGPLDLLIYLIKRDELDIYDIPIAHITKEYLTYIVEMNKLDLTIAGEFLVMAAILLEIKAKMMLPKPCITEIDEELESEDPRKQLVDKLLSYRFFKELSLELARIEEETYQYIPIAPRQLEIKDEPIDYDIDVDLTDLIETWLALKERMKSAEPPVSTTPYEDLDIRVEWLLDKVTDKEKKNLANLLEGVEDKQSWIVSFLAILETCKRQELLAFQSELFGNIWVWKARN